MRAQHDTFRITDDTPIAALSVGQFKELCQSLGLSIQKPDPPPNNLLNVDEVAQMTGYTKATIYKFTHARQIPFHRPAHGGRKLIFVRKEIEDWMQEENHETIKQYYLKTIK